jgi:hypothetical protein
MQLPISGRFFSEYGSKMEIQATRQQIWITLHYEPSKFEVNSQLSVNLPFIDDFHTFRNSHFQVRLPGGTSFDMLTATSPNHHGMIYPTRWIPKVGKTMMYHGNSMDLRFSPTKKKGLPHGPGILGDSQQLISLKKTMNTPTPSFDFPIPPVKHGSHLQGWSLQRPAIMFIRFP